MTPFPQLTITPDVIRLIDLGAPVAIGVSGGKDSDAAAIATNDELDRRGHTGPRLLIHSDLGRVEWRASLPQCEKLAAFLGLELVVVRRAAGDMMDRWLSRWAANCERYENLETVRLVLPWSTSGMRFCTSEMKTAVICRELVRRFPYREILSVAGLRREESPKRAKAPICKPQKLLHRKLAGTRGFDWLPILDWKLEDVLRLHHERGFPMHEAYQTNSRVSCAFCILASQSDLLASTNWTEHHDLYREMVGLEAESTFGFQDAHWLGDLAPHLLSADLRAAHAEAKARAARRVAIESRIPAHLLFDRQGWPTIQPTKAEARLLAEVRTEVAGLLRLQALYLDGDSVFDRYAGLIQQRHDRLAA